MSAQTENSSSPVRELTTFPAESSPRKESIKRFHSTLPQPPTSTSTLRMDLKHDRKFSPKVPLSTELAELFSHNILAKVLHCAITFVDLQEGGGTITPKGFPEYVPQDGDFMGMYQLREVEFWTCGFFPGTLHGMLERVVKYPHTLGLADDILGHNNRSQVRLQDLRLELLRLCNIWTKPLHSQAERTDTHDVGFIVMPALRLRWELTGCIQSLNSIKTAAQSLASRFVPSAGAIRSWDERNQKNIQITCKKKNLITIIDSLCNLDLLFYASKLEPENKHLADIATTHATTLLRTHLRPEPHAHMAETYYSGQWYSVMHVVNLDPVSGDIQEKFTAQGYSDTSTWARGQAWSILGYSQTYMWTKDKRFLQAACGLAEYFVYRLRSNPPFIDINDSENFIDTAQSTHHGGRFVPPWDFDAPLDEDGSVIRDSSAGAIAANGLLILSQALAGLGYDKLSVRFRTCAIDLVRDLLTFALAPERAMLVSLGEDSDIQAQDTSVNQHFESILKYGTANYNKHARKQYCNHGLVYGDYYLVEFGNQLLRMGLY